MNDIYIDLGWHDAPITDKRIRVTVMGSDGEGQETVGSFIIPSPRNKRIRVVLVKE